MVEIASTRLEAHEKGKKRKMWRVILTTVVFVVVVAALAIMMPQFWVGKDEPLVEVITVPYTPTIEVIDENIGEMNGQLTARMSEYIGQAEADLRELGYVPTKAIIPSGAIREVDFYLDGYNGRIKMTIDRGSGVSAEDTDRMIRYLKGVGKMDFEYIDVRVEGKGYYK